LNNLTKRIHLISGPRNISTALMYSFGNRADTDIVDEPFYAYYLTKHPEKNHPGRDLVLASQSNNYETVLNDIVLADSRSKYLFIKNMAHHLIDSDWSFLEKVSNVFLIRNPEQLIASFAQVISEPTMLDIGLKLEHDLFLHSQKLGQPAIVLDSNEVLKNPESLLNQLCDKLKIKFDRSMLSWKKGPRKEDGVWAEFWYKNVHNSQGFSKQKTSERSFPKHLSPLLEEASYYYNELSQYALKA